MYLRNPAGLGSLVGCVICITLIWSIASSATRGEADADLASVGPSDDSTADLYGTPELYVGVTPSSA